MISLRHFINCRFASRLSVSPLVTTQFLRPCNFHSSCLILKDKSFKDFSTPKVKKAKTPDTSLPKKVLSEEELAAIKDERKEREQKKKETREKQLEIQRKRNEKLKEKEVITQGKKAKMHANSHTKDYDEFDDLL
jgi:hypothetical protein